MERCPVLEDQRFVRMEALRVSALTTYVEASALAASAMVVMARRAS